MNLFTKVLFLGAVLVFVGIPEEILAGFDDDSARAAKPHEVWNDCGTWCEDTCQHQAGPGDACVAMCKRGWFCAAGYIREAPGGNCILRNECPPVEQH